MRMLLGWMVMVIVAGDATGLAEERFLRAHRPIPGQYIVILDRSLPADPPAHDINSASLASATGIRAIQRMRSGTSFSAPIVSGLAAQALQWDPQLGPTHVWSYLSGWSTLLPNSGDPHDPPQDPATADNYPDVGALKFAQTRPCTN